MIERWPVCANCRPFCNQFHHRPNWFTSGSLEAHLKLISADESQRDYLRNHKIFKGIRSDSPGSVQKILAKDSSRRL